VISTNFSVISCRLSTVRPSLHRQPRSGVAYNRASNSCYLPTPPRILANMASAAGCSATIPEATTYPTDLGSPSRNPSKSIVMLCALRASPENPFSHPEQSEGCRRDLAAGTLGAPTPPFSVKPPCPPCLRGEPMVQCSAGRDGKLQFHRYPSLQPQSRVTTMSNPVLLLTGWLAAQSVLRPLCLRRQPAAEYHVGLAEDTLCVPTTTAFTTTNMDLHSRPQSAVRCALDTQTVERRSS